MLHANITFTECMILIGQAGLDRQGAAVSRLAAATLALALGPWLRLLGLPYERLTCPSAAQADPAAARAADAATDSPPPFMGDSRGLPTPEWTQAKLAASLASTAHKALLLLKDPDSGALRCATLAPATAMSAGATSAGAPPAAALVAFLRTAGNVMASSPLSSTGVPACLPACPPARRFACMHGLA